MDSYEGWQSRWNSGHGGEQLQACWKTKQAGMYSFHSCALAAGILPPVPGIEELTWTSGASTPPLPRVSSIQLCNRLYGLGVLLLLPFERELGECCSGSQPRFCICMLSFPKPCGVGRPKPGSVLQSRDGTVLLPAVVDTQVVLNRLRWTELARFKTITSMADGRGGRRSICGKHSLRKGKVVERRKRLIKWIFRSLK